MLYHFQQIKQQAWAFQKTLKTFTNILFIRCMTFYAIFAASFVENGALHYSSWTRGASEQNWVCDYSVDWRVICLKGFLFAKHHENMPIYIRPPLYSKTGV